MKIPSERELELLGLVITERSGREVAKAYEDQAGRRIPYGTIYTTFAQMEELGWVRITQAEEGDRRVRRIKITGGGIDALNLANQHHHRLAKLAAGAASAAKKAKT